jgi:hypothetical protein
MIPLFKAMWRAQHAFLHGLIQTQNRILMAVTYLIAIAPVALVFKLMGKRLLPEVPRDAESYWIPRDDGPLDMDRAQRMF